jgi:thioredoxin 1
METVKENIIQVTPETFQAEVLECDKPVLVTFYAAWDQPCRMQQTELDTIADKHPEIKVCKIDVEEYTAFAQQYGIMIIPTTIAFKDGKKCKRATGLRRAGVLLSMVQ